MSRSTPRPLSEAWKACAVPWKLVVTVAGMPSSRWARFDQIDGLAEGHAGRPG